MRFIRFFSSREKFRAIIRKLSKFAWDEFLFDVSRVEWKYGRNDDGTPKRWTEWENVRDPLREAKRLRQPQELNENKIKRIP